MIRVGIHGVFHVSGGTNEGLSEACDQVMETLVQLEKAGGNVRDAAVAVDLRTRLVEVELVGEGDSFDAARSAAESAVRSAIHKTGGHTGNLVKDNRFRVQAMNAELVDA